MDRHRPHLARLRHRLQALAMRAADPSPLAADADEMSQNAGEKGIKHPDPEDPPRRRAYERPGHGNFAIDRPPVADVAGRDTGGLRTRGVERTDRATLEAFVRESARPGAMVCSRTINTSFVKRRQATDRGRNARKARKTYRFSKDWRVHEAMTH